MIVLFFIIWILTGGLLFHFDAGFIIWSLHFLTFFLACLISYTQKALFIKRYDDIARFISSRYITPEETEKWMIEYNEYLKCRPIQIVLINKTDELKSLLKQTDNIILYDTIFKNVCSS